MSKLSHLVIFSAILGFSLTSNIFADEPTMPTTTQATAVVQPATDVAKKVEVTEEKVTTEVTKAPVVKKTVKKVKKCGCKHKCKVKKAKVESIVPAEAPIETTAPAITENK